MTELGHDLVVLGAVVLVLKASSESRDPAVRRRNPTDDIHPYKEIDAMKSMTRMATLLVALALAAATLAACGSSGSDSAGSDSAGGDSTEASNESSGSSDSGEATEGSGEAQDITLWLAGIDTPEAALTYLTETYAATNGGELTIEQIGWGDLIPSLTARCPTRRPPPTCSRPATPRRQPSPPSALTPTSPVLRAAPGRFAPPGLRRCRLGR
ncbi:MAG: hypothetical protein R2710_06760 [Acidimicrobiales bacterium]